MTASECNLARALGELLHDVGDVRGTFSKEELLLLRHKYTISMCARTYRFWNAGITTKGADLRPAGVYLIGVLRPGVWCASDSERAAALRHTGAAGGSRGHDL